MTTNPNRQDIINAYDSLEELKNAALKSADFCGDIDHFLMCKDEILKVLPSKPEPTMAEIGWDDDDHYLAEAEHPIYGPVIMTSEGMTPGTIHIIHHNNEAHCLEVKPSELTPTGHRYVRTV